MLLRGYRKTPMLLWVLFALMTAAVLAALLRPLVRGSGVMSSDAAADIAVYKDQLTEIDADVARGLVGPADAEPARREIARRLLARADASGESATRSSMAMRTSSSQSMSSGVEVTRPSFFAFCVSSISPAGNSGTSPQ